MKKATSRWIPHQQTHEQRVQLCREYLAKFQNSSWVLYDIITGDERWIYNRQIHHKSKDISWLDEGELPTTVVRRSRFEGKNFFSILFK